MSLPDDDAQRYDVHNEMSGHAHTVIQAGNVHGDIIVNTGGVPPHGVGNMLPTPPNHVVARPELAEQLVEPLLRDGQEEVVALVGVAGTGGFGKTTLAGAICRDDRVVRRFPGGTLWVTIGEHVHGAELAGKINDLSSRLSGHRPLFTDPEQAGHHLGRLLHDTRCLLVVDDVWSASQLAPFLLGAPHCRRLVTTRIRNALPVDTVPVTVDAMTPTQARALLGEGLPAGTEHDLEPLLARTGGWPVLLTLVNRVVHQYVRRGASVADAAVRVADRLARRGPTAVDVTNADQRGLAIAATVEVGLSLLAETDPGRLDRFLELAVFPEDVAVPQETLVGYWQWTGGLDADEVEQLCIELDELSLVQGLRLGPAPELRIHDVIGAYLRHRAGSRMSEFHRALLESFRTCLPRDDEVTAWWELPDTEPYLRRHLAHHLHQAELADELDTVVCDFRWLHATLRLDGPAAAEADLDHATSPPADPLRRATTQNAHLLDPISGESNGLGTTLLSRLHGYPELTDYAHAASMTLSRPRLCAAWPLPDTPHPSSQRVLTHTDQLLNVAISPDGSWLAAGSWDNTAQLWNTDGSPRATLTGHADLVNDVVISPDGSWLATCSWDGTARLWSADGDLRATFLDRMGHVRDVAADPDGDWLATGGDDCTVRLWNTDGTPRATLTGHASPVWSVTISPDGSWFATTNWNYAVSDPDPTVRLWNVDGTLRATLTGHTGPVRRVAISPDSSWLATAGDDETVRLWNTGGSPLTTLTELIHGMTISPDSSWLATAGGDGTVRLWNTDGTPRATLTGHASPMTSVVISPDGGWLAITSLDGPIRLWNTDGSPRATLTGHTRWVRDAAISPDGSWLATAGDDETVRLWNTDGNPRTTSTEHIGPMTSMAVSPHGGWLATTSLGGTVRLWNTDGTQQTTLATYTGHTGTGHTGKVVGMAISPHGGWLATAGGDGTVRLWSVDGTLRATLTGHTGPVHGVAISPDGDWLATGSSDHTVRVWNTDGSPHATLTGHTGPVNGIAISPDGDWLATTSTDQTVRVWSTTTYRCVSALKTDSSLHRVAWFLTGSRIAVVGSSHLYAFRLDT